MTTEAGGGVPQELRERMIAVNQPCFLMIDDDERVDFPDLPALMIDKAIAEIAAAGYKLVPDDWIMCVQADGETLLPGFDPDQYDLGRGEETSDDIKRSGVLRESSSHRQPLP
jgi:hypothetical protein